MTKRIMKTMRLKEVSAVDRPAQPESKMTLMKRASMTKRIALTTVTEGHQHSLSTMYGDMSESRRGSTSYSDGHSHEFIIDEDGNIVLGLSNGHTHDIALLVAKNDESIPDESILAALVTKGSASSVNAAQGGSKESSMTPEEKAAFEKAANDKLEAMTKRAERAEKVAALNEAQRNLFSKMDVAEQDKFLALEPAKRQEAVAKSLEADAVIETIDGMEFRKSDDPRLLAMAKQARKDRVEREEMAKKLQVEQLTKRATDELPNLPGDVDTKVALLEAVDSVPVEKREKVLAVLKAHNAKLAKSFAELGTSSSPKGGEGSPEDKLNQLAKAIQDKEPTLSAAQAFRKAVNSEEGKKLYEEHISQA